MTVRSAVKIRSSISCVSRTFDPLIAANTRIPPSPCWRTSQGTDSAAVAPSMTIAIARITTLGDLEGEVFLSGSIEEPRTDPRACPLAADVGPRSEQRPGLRLLRRGPRAGGRGLT